MNVGDPVRIGTNGVSQFRIVEIDGDRALIQSVLDVPGAYPFSMRLCYLVAEPTDGASSA